jgi:hypothetical protein
MYLMFAVFWLLVAAFIFITGDPRFILRLGGIDLSGGWLALVLALYCLVRWWSRRSYRQQRQAELEAQAERERRRREERRAEENAAPNPNLIFTDTPPRPEEPER